ncbi:MAG: hypothetical protein GYA14_11740, partial [Ignavibacteria bacterium]|nr:hypothetical protein [Ignavibacteria bacterium]
MKNQVGIWLDSKNAFILNISNKEEKLIKIKSDVESRVRFYGENKKYTRMGNLFIDPEKTKEQRRQHQMKKYINEIINHLEDASEIYITGPAQTKILLSNEIEKKKTFSNKIL